MPDDYGPATQAEAFALILARLDRIAADVAELKAPAAERDLLRAIAVAAGTAVFSVAELLRHASLDPGLRAAILACVGASEPARCIGQLLRRSAGREVAGVTVERLGNDGAAIWACRVRPLKPELPIVETAARPEDVG